MTVIHADNDLEYWARDYWLGHCEGFHVEDETRGLGVVERVLGGEDDPDRARRARRPLREPRLPDPRGRHPRGRAAHPAHRVHLERERAA